MGPPRPDRAALSPSPPGADTARHKRTPDREASELLVTSSCNGDCSPFIALQPLQLSGTALHASTVSAGSWIPLLWCVNSHTLTDQLLPTLRWADFIQLPTFAPPCSIGGRSPLHGPAAVLGGSEAAANRTGQGQGLNVQPNRSLCILVPTLLWTGTCQCDGRVPPADCVPTSTKESIPFATLHSLS